MHGERTSAATVLLAIAAVTWAGRPDVGLADDGKAALQRRIAAFDKSNQARLDKLAGLLDDNMPCAPTWNTICAQSVTAIRACLAQVDAMGDDHVLKAHAGALRKLFTQHLAAWAAIQRVGAKTIAAHDALLKQIRIIKKSQYNFGVRAAKYEDYLHDLNEVADRGYKLLLRQDPKDVREIARLVEQITGHLNAYDPTIGRDGAHVRLLTGALRTEMSEITTFSKSYDADKREAEIKRINAEVIVPGYTAVARAYQKQEKRWEAKLLEWMRKYEAAFGEYRQKVGLITDGKMHQKCSGYVRKWGWAIADEHRKLLDLLKSRRDSLERTRKAMLKAAGGA